MINHILCRFGTLTLFSMFTLMGMTSLNSILALTADKEANRVCTKGSAAVITVKDGKGSLNSNLDVYTFPGETGQKVVIQMNSQKMNSFLTLYQIVESDQEKNYEKIAENDDIRAGDFNAIANPPYKVTNHH
ncbi:hypothetical protein [Trichormus sp. NMC-1]|uniref:hypothetical protein n=1 Tax=Trichormus sp. NMC-1 TaxID=1853259 RepID=UPI00115FAA3B|nr:hypothetical protein [Trichormus sp. NMC-1]